MILIFKIQSKLTVIFNKTNDIPQLNDVTICLKIVVHLQRYAEKHQYKKQEGTL